MLRSSKGQPRAVHQPDWYHGRAVFRGNARWIDLLHTACWIAALVPGCARGRDAPAPSAAVAQPSEENVAVDRTTRPAVVEGNTRASGTSTATRSPRAMPSDYLGFADACAGEEIVTIAAIGDVLMHHELQKQAYAADKGFRVIWADLERALSTPDITYANLEVPIASGLAHGGVQETGEKSGAIPADDPGKRFDDHVYSGYPFFNAHPSLASDLTASGVDVVSTANNHALDRGSEGIDRTLAALDAAKLAHTGTRPKGSKDPWHAITQAKDTRIAWLACTLHTNFGKDKFGQVLHCFKQRNELLAAVRALAADASIDAVIVTPHWGKEYDPVPQDKQRTLARELVDAGAIAVLGAHPHVLQPWEKLTSTDGREAFVVYSLGNFAHHQRSLPRRASIVLYLGLRRRQDGELAIAGVRYLPIHVRMVGDKQAFFVESIDRAGGPADARQLIVDMYGASNLIGPDEPIDVRPQCR